MPHLYRHIVPLLCSLSMLTACTAGVASTPEAIPSAAPTIINTIPAVPTVPAEPTHTPSAPTVEAPTPTPIISTTATMTLTPDLETALAELAARTPFDLGIAVIDLRTGETVHIDGESRYYALSTFKGPLAVYYLWLIERGQLTAIEGDEAYLAAMLSVSDNPATTCMLQRVGGIAAFNDWLAGQGMDRANNFVYTWNSWLCPDTRTTPENDWRYRDGDVDLGIPADRGALTCPEGGYRCDKAFTPLELARFYQRLYDGEVISAESFNRWLNWVEKDREDSVLLAGLPGSVDARAFVKNGYAYRGNGFEQHYYHEAGFIMMGDVPLVVAVFTQGNSTFPGEDIFGEVMSLVYGYLGFY